MNFAVVVFPGTNCDRETHHVLTQVLGQPADLVWHETTDISSYDCIVLPGGFAHGDHLRAGAIARFSPIVSVVERFADRGGLVLGICNGFQILLEAGLLPGAMLRNASQQFRCQWTHLRVESIRTPFLAASRPGQVLRLPIAHGEGNYLLAEAELARMEARGQIVLRYCEPNGAITEQANPNGSIANVAGVCNPDGNVFGLMPHPERASEDILGSSDGRVIFESLLLATANVGSR